MEICGLLVQHAPREKVMNCDTFYEVTKDSQFCGLGAPSLRSIFNYVMLEVVQ